MDIVAAKKKEEIKTINATKEISIADLQLHPYAVFGRMSYIYVEEWFLFFSHFVTKQKVFLFEYGLRTKNKNECVPARQHQQNTLCNVEYFF